jgi:cyclophilin family peptidyl-prolyl cis-trans isomerase
LGPQLTVPLADPVGGWRADMTASYSTCAEIKVGQARSVRWKITRDAKKPEQLSLLDRGEKGETAKTYVGNGTASGAFELRAGKTAGIDLRDSGGGRLAGRLVASRKLGCVVIYDLVAERTFDEPVELGDADPDAAGFSLRTALAGLPEGSSIFADLVTDAGVITCELYADRAPIAVANFVGLARGLRAWKDPKRNKFVRYQAYYDGQAFHRVIPGFIIQAGDPQSKDWTSTTVGTGGPGYTIADEQTGLKFDRPGRLAMANKGPNTNSSGSQFFISEAKAPQLDGGYTVFGQCGPIEVIKVAARVPSNPQTNRPDLPLTLQKVVIHR